MKRSTSIKEITVFTNGDATKPSTWSNVPYFFTKTLAENGIKVNQVNIGPNKFIKTIYRFTIWQILKRLKKHNSYEYYRTKIHKLYADYLIKKAIIKYPNAQLNLFLSFSFSAKKYSQKPTVLFGDWTYEYYFQYFKNRNPGSLEQTFINRENHIIETADLTFVLFPKVAAIMQTRYPKANINYIGNVINAEIIATKNELLIQKENSYSVLFIGGKKYTEGAKNLINAIKELQLVFPEISLDIIGMNATDFDNLPNNVTCHGYLDKGIESDRKKYYELMQHAKVYVNTTPIWSAFSATVEAMYFYNPVIITPFDEFTETFGKHIEFGIYSNGLSLADDIKNIFLHKNYFSLCEHAHKAVQEFTWSNYIHNFLNACENKLFKQTKKSY